MDNYTTKLAVRDSLDDEDLSDVDDEVFIRDGKNGSKQLVEDRGVKRPLMAPRRKMCKDNMRSRHPPCKIKCVFYCYAVIALLILLGLIGLTVLLVSLYPIPIDRLKPWFSSSKHANSPDSVLIRPCTSLRVSTIWNITVPKILTEAPIRAIDVNKDGVKDIIIGFETENGLRPFPYLCPIFFNNQTPCKGGVLAIDGKTGATVWQHWTAHVVYLLDCSSDFNGDKTLDCLVMGRGGLLCTIDGTNGTLLWQFSSTETQGVILDVYVGQVIPDQDGDGIVDILVSHTSQKGNTRSGHIVLVSGKTGSEIVEIPTPGNKETYYMPQLLKRIVNNTSTNSTGEQLSTSTGVLFGTGGQDTPGALYIVPLVGFSIGKKNIMKPMLLYQDRFKGFLQPAILVDITGDGYEDIIINTFNSSLIAIDGVNYKQIWNFTRNESESYSSVIPGYFNDDNVTDFLIKFNKGHGFPEYYYAETLLIDGKTGKQVLHKPVIESAPSATAGLTISVESHGFDLFLYWIGVCKGHDDFNTIYEEFHFVQGNSIWAQSRADICKLRYNSTLVLKLYALNQYDQPPGILIYSSDEHGNDFNVTFNVQVEIDEFLKNNPSFQFVPYESKLREDSGETIYPRNNQKMNSNLYLPSKNIPQTSSFRHKGQEEGILRDYVKNDYPNVPHGTNGHKHIEGDEMPNTQWSRQTRPALDWSNDQYVQEGALPLDSNLPIPIAEDEVYEDILDSKIADQTYPLSQGRDPRSKDRYEEKSDSLIKINDTNTKNETEKDAEIIKQRLLSKLNSYDEYTNTQNAKNRLLHDLSNIPKDILRESYLENAEKDLRLLNSNYNEGLNLRTNKFEQRDLRYRQNDKNTVKKELESMYDEKRRESLWDLESEKEQYDREHGYWRGKREMVQERKFIPRIDSTGVLVKTLSTNDNSIDFVFGISWLPAQNTAQIILPQDKLCIEKKMERAKAPQDNYHNLEKTTMEDLFTKMCLAERGVKFLDPQNDKLNSQPSIDDQISLGQLTLYRINLQCDCGPLLENESCGRILDNDKQSWNEYLGNNGKGYYMKHD